MTPPEDARIEETLTVDWGGEAVTLVARADWGVAEVRLTGRHAPLTAARDRRGWSFAVMAAHKPETRYAFRGHITPRGHGVIR